MLQWTGVHLILTCLGIRGVPAYPGHSLFHSSAIWNYSVHHQDSLRVCTLSRRCPLFLRLVQTPKILLKNSIQSEVYWVISRYLTKNWNVRAHKMWPRTHNANTVEKTWNRHPPFLLFTVTCFDKKMFHFCCSCLHKATTEDYFWNYSNQTNVQNVSVTITTLQCFKISKHLK